MDLEYLQQRARNKVCFRTKAACPAPVAPGPARTQKLCQIDAHGETRSIFGHGSRAEPFGKRLPAPEDWYPLTCQSHTNQP
jgi:hypothetical protein